MMQVHYNIFRKAGQGLIKKIIGCIVDAIIIALCKPENVKRILSALDDVRLVYIYNKRLSGLQEIETELKNIELPQQRYCLKEKQSLDDMQLKADKVFRQLEKKDLGW